MSEKNDPKNSEKQDGKERKTNGPADDKQAAAAPEHISVPKPEYDALVAKAAERDALGDKYLRAHAEFENIRKRFEKDKADFVKYANEGLIYEFLPIVDSLELAEKFIKEAKDFKAVREGVDMIQSQIQKFLKDIGLERVKAVGEKFDPHIHDAIETEESGDKEEGLVVAELKPGYRLNDKLLRPASVKIVKKV